MLKNITTNIDFFKNHGLRSNKDVKGIKDETLNYRNNTESIGNELLSIKQFMLGLENELLNAQLTQLQEESIRLQ